MTRRLPLGALIVALAVFIADQLVKYWVTGPLGIANLGDSREIVSFFDLRFVPNVGVSLGLLPADSEAMRWGLVAMTGAIALGVLIWMTREKNRHDLLALGLILGGALGNIVDRVRFGYVVDYADLHFGDFRPFLVFNVADAAITFGVVILIARAFLVRDKDQAEPNVESGTAPVEKDYA